MCSARASVACSLSLLIVLHSAAALVSAKGSTASTPWLTLSGNAPLVIARGGFSGLFPDSSFIAYGFVSSTSLPNAVLWCDVQLTKDEVGICFPDLKLDNASNVANSFSSREETYNVNGSPIKGLFSLDFNYSELSSNVFLLQGIFSRTNKFDSSFNIVTVEDVATGIKPTGFWLNIQHDVFYQQHKLSMRSYVIAVSRRVVVNYISSPEVGFLRSIVARFNPITTKLVFRFLGEKEIEPSTNQTYGSLLTNLTFIKTFASGILVPKSYIYPVDEATMYLQPFTSVVSDAHNAGLEIYASDFANDGTISYNYSFDPLAEYLSFVDNSNFSVDGVLSDFPITPSAAIECFSHLGGNAADQINTLVISRNGASGDYPGCTDLAYNAAISGGVDILDCPVQMSKDGTPFCLGSVNLIESTSVTRSPFNNRSLTIPAIKAGAGIYTFSLTWHEIQTLQSAISNPYSDYRLYRNKGYNGKGKFLSLSEFLALTNTSSLSGILIRLENAAYLAQNQGLGVINAVLDELSKGGYDNRTTQKVMIQSTDSSVLMEFKEKSNYELVYEVDEQIRDALSSAVDDIKNVAHSVVITKTSVFPDNYAFLVSTTNVVSKLQQSNLSVYVKTFRNEFVSQAWDFFSDPTVELNTYVGANIDGVITEFPKTAVRYKKNKCLNLGDETPPYMRSVQPGSLLSVLASISPQLLPPTEAPSPLLTESDVAEAPFPPVSAKVPDSGPDGTGTPTTSPTPPNGQPKRSASVLLSGLATMLAVLFLLH